MKTKLFLAAVAVTFSFAMMSCAGNKTTNAASEGVETTAQSETLGDCVKILIFAS